MTETLYSLTNISFSHPLASGNHHSILWLYEFGNSTYNEMIEYFSFSVSLIPPLDSSLSCFQVYEFPFLCSY